MIPSRTPTELRRTNADPSPSDSVIGSSARRLARLRRVVVVDRRAEVHLAERLLDGLAHLPHDDLRELLAALRVQLADAPNERRTLLDRRRTRPLAMGAVGGRDGVGECRVADRRVLLDALARRRIGHCVVAHVHPPSDRRRPHAKPISLWGRMPSRFGHSHHRAGTDVLRPDGRIRYNPQMRILVVGTGGVGSAFARIAQRRSFFEHCALADYDVTRAESVVVVARRRPLQRRTRSMPRRQQAIGRPDRERRTPTTS